MVKEKLQSKFWEERFYKDVSGLPRGKFRVPYRYLPKFAKLLRKIKAKNVLDLGCGTGRNTIALARMGFKVYGIDIVPKAVRMAKAWLKHENLRADIKIGDIYKKLPYRNNFFDGVISIAVLHHAKVFQIKKLIKELEKVMRAGGILMVQVPKKEKTRFREDKEIEPGTFLRLKGSEKGVLHHVFANKEELKSFFPDFKILDIRQVPIDKIQTFHSHYVMFAKLRK